MTDPYAVWLEVFERLGLPVVGAIEDGLRYAVDTQTVRIEADVRIFRDPVTVRVVVRPLRVDGDFLVAPAARVRATTRPTTGDLRFDEAVAILAGAGSLLPRLGPAERELLVDLVGAGGAVVGASEATIEPAIALRFTDPKSAMATVRDLVRIANRLASDPPFDELFERWLQGDGAAGVASAVSRRVAEILPAITEEQAALACRLLVERNVDGALGLVTRMPPFPCVLSAWFQLGNPFDPQVGDRVIEAWRAGASRPVARYLSWLMAQPGARAPEVTRRLWSTPELASDPSFLKEFLRAMRVQPPAAALPYLLEVQPSSSSVARRLARVLQQYPSVDVDLRLLEWLQVSSARTREAAAAALAERAAQDLLAGRRRDRLRAVRAAAEQSGALLAALVSRVPPSHTEWLAPFRPHAEPDAILLIRRLGQGGADVDEALLFWLDRGSPAVRVEAARALGAAGSTRALPGLRERAAAWFSDGGVREACRLAADAIRSRGDHAGRLAVADARGGEVAVADPANAGRLRLVEGVGPPPSAPALAPSPPDDE